jgi:G6PDH family F420-dependent oxidoreductase
MFQLGYTLSSEEHDPRELVKFARWAEDAGFSFLSISDHFHPWVDEQGQSPFVWNMIGALSQVTKSTNIFIGVNCPIIRYHPVIVAQAAATSQVMLEGRFILGVGTGENLNEHIIGAGWPPFDQRLAMLNEAIQIMRDLWEGEYTTYFGDYYTVDSAKIYTKPEITIPIVYSAFGPKAAASAGKFGDAFISTGPNKDLIKIF